MDKVAHIYRSSIVRCRTPTLLYDPPLPLFALVSLAFRAPTSSLSLSLIPMFCRAATASPCTLPTTPELPHATPGPQLTWEDVRRDERSASLLGTLSETPEAVEPRPAYSQRSSFIAS